MKYKDGRERLRCEREEEVTRSLQETGSEELG